MNALVERLQLSFPGIKVILSEVTPRMDKIDERVIEANLLLRQFASGKPDLFITKNSNLRNPEFYMADGIHLNHSIIPRFASNIKRALRAAYGITYQKQPENSRRLPDTNYSNNYGNNPHNNNFTNNRNSDSNVQQHQQHQQQQQNALVHLILKIAQQFQYSGT